MTTKDDNFLNERAQMVLTGLVSRYISDGTPIGSRTLAKETELSLSPATIRNVMADLEDFGLIHAPHTSAGRVPTIKGYRMFINSLLKTGPIQNEATSIIEKRLNDVGDVNSVLTGATELISQITSYAGIVSIPGTRHALFKQIEFLKLSGNRVLAILVTDDGQVQNKVLPTDREYTESELVQAANYFNDKYSAKPLVGVRHDLLEHMNLDHTNMHQEMRTAIKMAGQLFDKENSNSSDSVVVSGENNLLSIPDFGEMDKLRKLFDTFKTKQVLFDLLQKSMFADGVNIFIGEESGYQIFQDCSVIAAPYEVDSERVGVLGVIGPTRMNYDEVISVVDVTAKLLGNTLSADSAAS